MPSKRFFSLSAWLLAAVLLFSFAQKAFWVPDSLAANADERFTVVIDAGHGGIDAGATGANGVKEKDLNLAIAMLLAEFFREAGVNVVMTRSTDALVLLPSDEGAPSRKQRDLVNRSDIAAQYPNALLLSVHMNSYPAPQYRGFECYYSENREESRVYAAAIQSAVVKDHEPYNKRGIKIGSHIFLLKHAVSPAVLIECGFLSNAEDAAKLSDKDYQKQLSFSIFCAIMEVNKKVSL